MLYYIITQFDIYFESYQLSVTGFGEETKMTNFADIIDIKLVLLFRIYFTRVSQQRRQLVSTGLQIRQRAAVGT